MSEIYVILKCGILLTEPVGLSYDRASAKRIAVEAIINEPDDYHTFQVRLYQIDVVSANFDLIFDIKRIKEKVIITEVKQLCQE